VQYSREPGHRAGAGGREGPPLNLQHGVVRFGMGLTLETGMIQSHVGSYIGENKLPEEKGIRGELDLKLIPARHPGREHSCRRGGNSRLLHSHGRRNFSCGPERVAIV
jgi:hypothetical protein